MNERIRELWEKAAESTAAYPSGQNNSWETQVNFLDKFAESIVKECAAIIANDTANYQEEGMMAYYQGVQDSVKSIRKHFGVEE